MIQTYSVCLQKELVLIMFVDLSELKGIMIDLDSVEQTNDDQWRSLSHEIKYLFFSSNEDRLETIKTFDERFLIFNGALFSHCYVTEIERENLAKSLAIIDLPTYHIALFSKNLKNLLSIKSIQIGTILLSPSSDFTDYDRVGKLPDFEVETVEGINDILKKNLTGFTSEVVSTVFNNGNKLQWNLTSVCLTKLKIEELDRTVELIFGGRYFGHMDSRHRFHQLSQRVLKNKAKSTNQVKVFLTVFGNLIDFVNEIDKVSGITRIPPRPQQFDRFEPIIEMIHKARPCFENHSKSFRANRNFESQKALDAESRIKNVDGVFEFEGSLENKHMVIIDDVVTTGATAKEAARVLYSHGASKVTFIALAVNQFGMPVLHIKELSCTRCGNQMKMLFTSDDSAIFECSGSQGCGRQLSYFAGLRQRNIQNEEAIMNQLHKKVEDFFF